MRTRLGYSRLLKAIEATNGNMGSHAVSVVNQALTLRNWRIGSHLVEYEQNGLDRAKYGERLLDRLSEDLKKKGIKGLDVRGLRDCRLFFRFYPQIRGSMTPESKRLPSAGLSTSKRSLEKGLARAPSPPSADMVLRFSWTHILEFVGLDDPWKRAFYENECLTRNPQLSARTETKKAGFFTNKKVQVVAGTTDKLFCEGKRPDFFVESRDSTGDFGLKAHWSVRQLQRQIESLL